MTDYDSWKLTSPYEDECDNDCSGCPDADDCDHWHPEYNEDEEEL